MDKEMDKVNFDKTSSNTDIIENFTTQSNRNSPMELTPVIRCILQYLNVNNVKSCRLLNNDWSSAGLLVLKRRSKIVFKRDSNGVERTPGRFLEIFPDFEQAIPFTAFQIVGGHREWRVSELDEFFQRQRNSIRELELCSLTLYNDVGVVQRTFDFSSWLSNSAMTLPNAKYHTKLSVLYKENDDHYVSTVLSVAASTIANVKEIIFHFNLFHLTLQDRIKLNPTKLKFHEIACSNCGSILRNFSINEFVNLRKIKKMDIYNHAVGLTDVTIDMSGNNGLDIEYLCLFYVKTANFGKCNWKVVTLNLCGTPFQERTEMSIKEFYFLAQNGSTVDFSVLPPTIEKLAVVALLQHFCLCSSASIFLPNLNSLYLCGLFRSIFPKFTKCPIVELRLVGPFEIQFNCIPKTVRNLAFQHVVVRVKPEDKTLKLEKLVLRITDLEFQCQPTREHLYGTHFVAETLVLPLAIELIPGERFFEFLQSYKNCLDSHQRFCIGPFVKNDEHFSNSTLANFVDISSNYYLFENINGKAIDKATFQNLEIVGPVDMQIDTRLQNLFYPF